MERKRITVLITGDKMHGMNVAEFLRKSGVDAKLVSKHAVQVHPDHFAQASEASKRWPPS